VEQSYGEEKRKHNTFRYPGIASGSVKSRSINFKVSSKGEVSGGGSETKTLTTEGSYSRAAWSWFPRS